MRRMKRLELLIGVPVVLLLAAVVVAFFLIPRSGPAGPAGRTDPARAVDPARRLWAADPARSVFVFGEAARPGAHEIPAGESWTLADLVRAVGGFTPEAAGRARLARKVDGAIAELLNVSREELEDSGVKLEPGDVIYLD